MIPATALVLALLTGAPPATSPATPPPAAPEAARPLLLANLDHHPTVRVSWTTRDGERIELEGERAYTDDKHRESIGRNIDCFAAVGGTRLSKGAGHPDGLIVRVGFYKTDPTALFFDAIPEDGRVRVELSSIQLNQPANAFASSVVQHLKFAPEQLEACQLPGEARDQFNTASTTDTLNKRIAPNVNARLGALSSDSADGGTTRVTLADDATLSLVCEFPYALLRHLQDPWRSTVPGTFVEPIHFHIELEILPEPVFERIESGEEPWPPPDRMLDESGSAPPINDPRSSGDDEPRPRDD